MEIDTIIFLLLFISVSASSGKAIPPQILLPPEDTFPVEGHLEFSCKATGFPEPQITWYDGKTRKRLDYSLPNIHINQYLGRLTIAEPQPKRIYSVYCNVSNKAGWVESPVVKGGLAYLESDFPRFPIDSTVEEGDIVLMECQPPKGVPPPTTQWLFNNAELPPGRGSISPEGDLHIREVKPHHAGTYSCRARNAAGERISPSAVLQVKRKAVHIVQKPADVQATLGSTVTFRCQASDSLPVVWTRGSGERPSDISRVQTSSFSVTIRNVQPSDAGRYICVSSDGSASAEAKLTIVPGAKVGLSRFPVDQNATEGETVVFHCPNSASRSYSTYWDLPNQASVFPNDRIGNIYMNEQGDLQIRGVRISDSGLYQCTIDSDVGLITKKAVLRVLPRLNRDTNPLPPIINLPPANQTRLAGETVILDCEVGITREPEMGFGFESIDSNVFWVRGTRSTGGLQERIEFVHRDRDPRFSLLPGGGLKIDGVMVEDTGNYTCFMQSGHGSYMQSNWTAGLIVLPSDSHPSLTTAPVDLLSPPENLRILNQTENSVTLMWNPPNVHDTNLVSYWIEMFHTAESELGWQVLQESWPRNAIHLEPLQPNSAYYFLIRPRWIGGRIGWASAPLGPIQMQFHPSKLPNSGLTSIRLQGIQTQTVSSTSTRVFWNLESFVEATPLITGFSLQYKEVPLTLCTSANLQDGSFCSLRPGERFSSRLQAYQQQLNRVALKDTQGVSLVPHEEPEVFVDVPVDRNMVIGTPWSTLLQPLKPFRCYSLLIQPISIHKRHTNSEKVLFLTQEDVPSAPPQIVGVKKKSNHSVEISWSIPPTDSWNGLLTGFVVYVFDAAQNDKRELKFGYGETTGVVSGLKTGEVYHLQMTAVNCRGGSVKSTPIHFSVSEGGIISDGSSSSSTSSGLIQFQPWVVGVVVTILVIWLLAMFCAIIFCLRQKSQPKQRYPPSLGEDASRKDAYKLVTLVKPQQPQHPVSEIECPQGSDSQLKAPTATTQHNTSTTIASTNSSSTGGSCNHHMNHLQHTYEEGVPGQASDFSASPFFQHLPQAHMEYPFVEYRPQEVSNSSVFSASVIENSPTTTGLPLVAPVAQLGYSGNVNQIMDLQSSSVTPYATASLINAEVQHKNSGNNNNNNQMGSRTPSDMSSNAGGSHRAMVGMHSPQRYSVRPQQQSQQQQQYISRSSSGTTTGAEEDYLSHHQTSGTRRQTLPQTMTSVYGECDLRIPPPPLHQMSTQVTSAPTNQTVF